MIREPDTRMSARLIYITLEFINNGESICVNLN